MVRQTNKTLTNVVTKGDDVTTTSSMELLLQTVAMTEDDRFLH